MTPEEIARGLSSKAQDALIEAVDGFVALKHGYPALIGELVATGLMNKRVPGYSLDWRLTRLGLAVREALKVEAADG